MVLRKLPPIDSIGVRKGKPKIRFQARWIHPTERHPLLLLDPRYNSRLHTGPLITRLCYRFSLFLQTALLEFVTIVPGTELPPHPEEKLMRVVAFIPNQVTEDRDHGWVPREVVGRPECVRRVLGEETSRIEGTKEWRKGIKKALRRLMLLDRMAVEDGEW